MHSSRMRTARSLTLSPYLAVSHAHPPEQPHMPPLEQPRMLPRATTHAPPRADRILLLLFPNVMERRSLLVVYVFNFYQTLRVVPHGTKGTGPRFVMRPVYLRSQLRNNKNIVSTLILLIHLLHVLCTRYTGIAHHRALQTSRRGWADSKAVHRMECSGAHLLYWRSLSAGAAA